MSKTQQLLAAATPAPWVATMSGVSTAGYGADYMPMVAADDDLAVHLRNTADAAQAVIEAARRVTKRDTTYVDRKALDAALAAYDEADK